jgi:hypothetical protein
MSHSIFYKFKSEKDFDTIEIDGSCINGHDLKMKIATKKHLYDKNRFNKHDLQIIDANSGLEILDDNVIQHNSFVLLKRIPTTQDMKVFYTSPQIQAPQVINFDLTNMSEDEKINAITQATYNSWTSSKKTPPASYICHRCGESSHFIQDCPTNGNPNFNGSKYRPKRNHGIPNMKSIIQEPSFSFADNNKQTVDVSTRPPHMRESTRHRSYHPYQASIRRPQEKRFTEANNSAIVV